HRQRPGHPGRSPTPHLGPILHDQRRRRRHRPRPLDRARARRAPRRQDRLRDKDRRRHDVHGPPAAPDPADRAQAQRMKPRLFATPTAFRAWLDEHHATETELVVGFHKRATNKPCMTWSESVDEALCFGWIDAIRRRIDDDTYSI